MLTMAVPWWELIFRGVVVYLALLLLLRLTGKRQVGQLAPFDLVLLLVLSNAVQNAMNAGDNSLVGGLISAVTLIALNSLLGYLTFRSPTLEGIVEGRPQILIHNGQLYDQVMRAAKLTRHELNSALRQMSSSLPRLRRSEFSQSDASLMWRPTNFPRKKSS